MLGICQQMFDLGKDVVRYLRQIELQCQEGQWTRVERIVQECQPYLRGITQRAAFFAVMGESYAWIGRYQEAKAAYEQALEAIKGYDHQNVPAFAQTLRQRIIQALFFTLPVVEALELARTSALTELGIMVLHGIILWCQKDQRYELEVSVWQLVEELEDDPRRKRSAMFDWAKALLPLNKTQEALPLFLQIISEDDQSAAPYEYAGGILLLEGKEESFCYLERARDLGGSGLGFYRNLFIMEIIRGDYEKAKGALLFLTQNPTLACNLLDLFLLGVRPHFLHRFCASFERFHQQYEVKQGYPRKGFALLKRFLPIVEYAQKKDRELRSSFIPLARQYWGTDTVECLSYHECMWAIAKRSEQEARDFFATYERILDADEYWAFIGFLKEKKLPYGLMLLTYSQFLDIFADVCEELNCPYIQRIRFDNNQPDICLYDEGVVTFSGKGLLYIENEVNVKRDIRSVLREEQQR